MRFATAPVSHGAVNPTTLRSPSPRVASASKPLAPALGAPTFGEGRRLAFFAGLWTRWEPNAEFKGGETTNDLFGFLTTELNAEVNAIHPTAMPVILTTEAEVETWLTAPAKDALALQRPLPDGR